MTFTIGIGRTRTGFHDYLEKTLLLDCFDGSRKLWGGVQEEVQIRYNQVL